MIRVAVAGAAGPHGPDRVRRGLRRRGHGAGRPGRPGARARPSRRRSKPSPRCWSTSRSPTRRSTNARQAVAAGVHVVIGTTGFDAAALEELRDAPGNVFVAPNFAIGAVLMMQFAAQAARHMRAAEIIELHHDRKLDKPSGTAARTAELMAAGSRGGRLPGADPLGPPARAGRPPGGHPRRRRPDARRIRHDSIDRESFMPGVLLAVRRVGELTRVPGGRARAPALTGRRVRSGRGVGPRNPVDLADQARRSPVRWRLRDAARTPQLRKASGPSEACPGDPGDPGEQLAHGSSDSRGDGEIAHMRTSSSHALLQMAALVPNCSPDPGAAAHASPGTAPLATAPARR